MITVTMSYSNFLLYAAMASTVHQGLKVLYAKIWNHK
jgi:hypothetical protein